MTDPADTADLEDRLRRDLPRLADVLADHRVEPSASGEPGKLPRGDHPVAGAASAPSYTGGVTPVRRHDRRPALLVAAAVIAVVAIGVTFLATRDSSSESGIAAGPVSGEPTHGAWTDTAHAPVPGAEDASAVWTGEEVLLFGGHHLVDGVPHADQIAAAYNPAVNMWREVTKLPDMAPMVAATWAGDVAVVIGKAGGSVYDPKSDSWRDLPVLPTPQDPNLSVLPTQAVWAGDRILLPVERRSATDPQTYEVEVLELDRDAWTWEATSSSFEISGQPLADAPAGPTHAYWADGFVVIEAPVETTGGAGSVVLYDMERDSWEQVGDVSDATKPVPVHHAATAAVGDVLYRVGIADGGQLLAWQLDLEGRAGDEGTGTPQWQFASSIDEARFDTSLATSMRVVGGDDELIVLGLTGSGSRPPLELDATTNTWRDPISAAGPSWTGRATTWAGSRVFEWGGTAPASETDPRPEPTNAGRTWTPSPGPLQDSAWPTTTVSTGVPAEYEEEGPDGQTYLTRDLGRSLGPSRIGVVCVDGRQRIELAFTNIGTDPLEILDAEVAAADFTSDEMTEPPDASSEPPAESDLSSKMQFGTKIGEARIVGSPAAPGSEILIIGTVEGSWQGRATVLLTARSSVEASSEDVTNPAGGTDPAPRFGSNLGDLHLLGGC